MILILVNRSPFASTDTIDTSQSDDFDILEFWDAEIERVNNTALNVYYGENNTVEFKTPFLDKTYQLTIQEVYFNSPNWVGITPATLRIHGLILYPDEIKEKNPGCLIMHGLNGEIKDIFDLAIPYLEQGFLVLAHAHPGHGDSEGAEACPENLYYQGNYNESAHFYLTLCAAIQGLRVLENHTLVDTSKIFVTGASYGGLNAMWLSSICGERISGVVSYIAVGNIAQNLNYPSKLIFWILGKSNKEITDDYLNNQLLRFDPLFYLKSPKLPPILWQIGTNDDFFHYSCIKGTFEAVTHSEKFLQIFPNEHHGFPFFENSTKYFVDYILNNGTRPPSIINFEVKTSNGIIGDSVTFSVSINSTIGVSKVEIVYYSSDIIGTCWEKLSLMESFNHSWVATLNSRIFDSNIDFYIRVYSNDSNNTWFSSNIYSIGAIKSNYAFIFIFLISLFVVTPIILAMFKKFKFISRLDPKKRDKALQHTLLFTIGISIGEFLAYYSLFLPWVIYEKGGVIFTHIYFFNNIFTWKLFFGETASILTGLFFTIVLIFTILSFIWPIITGCFKMIYPGLVLVILLLMPVLSGNYDPNSLVSNFGLTFTGMGPFAMLSSAIIVLFIGRWDSKYFLKLGLRKAEKVISIKKLFLRLKKK